MAIQNQFSDPTASFPSASLPPHLDSTSAGSGEIDVLDLLLVVAARKRIILTVTATFFVVAIAVCLIQKPKYSATVSILPPQQSTSSSAALAAQLGSMGGSSLAALTGGFSLKSPNDVYIGMMRSRSVEDAMIQRFHLMDKFHTKNMTDTRKAFEHATILDGDARDKMIHISFEDSDPRQAAEMANGYVQEFQHFSEHMAISEAAQRRLFFQRELEGAKNNLATAEEALKQTQQSTGMIQLDSQARALVETTTTLRAQITAREAVLQGMQTYATGENAQIVQARQELESLRAQLARMGGGAADNNALLVPKGKVPEASLEYLRRLREVKYNETIFEILSRQFEAAKLDEARQGAVIQVVDPATPPDKKSGPRRYVVILGATVVGFLLSVFWSLAMAGLQYLQSIPASQAKLFQLRQLLSWRSTSVARGA